MVRLAFLCFHAHFPCCALRVSIHSTGSKFVSTIPHFLIKCLILWRKVHLQAPQGAICSSFGTLTILLTQQFAGASVSSVTNDGKTPLHLSLLNHHTDTAKVLIEAQMRESQTLVRKINLCVFCNIMLLNCTAKPWSNSHTVWCAFFCRICLLLSRTTRMAKRIRSASKMNPYLTPSY